MCPEPAARSARHVLRRMLSACSRNPRSSASLLLTVPASRLGLNAVRYGAPTPRRAALRSLYHGGWKQPPPPPCISSRARRASASPRSGETGLGSSAGGAASLWGRMIAVHAEGRDRITAVAFERDEERVRSLLGGRVDDQIRALPRPQQKTPDRFVSSQGLPIQGDDPALQSVQLQHEDARVGGVRQPQSKPLVTPNLAPPVAHAVDGHPIAETPPV